MKSYTNPILIAALAASFAVAACSGMSESDPSLTDSVTSEMMRGPRPKDEPDFGWWRAERAKRQAAVDAYIADPENGFTFFKDAPVGTTGVPVLVMALLPEMFPEHFARAGMPPSFEALGFMADPYLPNRRLPLGLANTKAKRTILEGAELSAAKSNPLLARLLEDLKPFAKAARIDQLSINVTQLSCAACHSGEVRDGEGKITQFMGAPSTRLDVQAFRTAVANSILSPKFTGSALQKMIRSKPRGWFYDKQASESFVESAFGKLSRAAEDLLTGDVAGANEHAKMLAQEDLERVAIVRQADQVVAGLKVAVEARDRLVKKHLQERVYATDTNGLMGKSPRLDGWSPGQLDAFGVGGAIMMEDGDDPAHGPPHAALIDPQAVWNQKDRSAANWDGDQPDRTARNVAAAFAVVGDAENLNTPSALNTVPFVEHLPSAPYPFDVDKVKADRGQKLFESACATCHTSRNDTKYALDHVGTDPNRATQLTALTRERFIKNVRIAAPELMKDISDNDIFRDVTQDIGYVAEPLDGIWARAPYFHNGSVPTLYQVLVPEARTPMFIRGNTEYDQKELGFAWDIRKPGTQVPGSMPYDTKLSGNHNTGHDSLEFMGGINWAAPERADDLWDLIEHMKTL